MPENNQPENTKGLAWIDQNREALRDAGFTDNDLYGQYPIGISKLNLWEKHDLTVVLDGGTIFFRWRGPSGNTITQTCSPERPLPPVIGGAGDFGQ